MINIYVKSGTSSIRSSGTLIPFENNDITVSFQLPTSEEGIFDVDVTFRFSEDEGRDSGFEFVNPQESMPPEDIERSEVYDVIIYNSDKSGGVSNQKPIMLGEYGGMPLYLNFKAEGQPSQAHKVLHYTFYTR